LIVEYWKTESQASMSMGIEIINFWKKHSKYDYYVWL